MRIYSRSDYNSQADSGQMTNMQKFTVSGSRQSSSIYNTDFLRESKWQYITELTSAIVSPRYLNCVYTDQYSGWRWGTGAKTFKP